MRSKCFKAFTLALLLIGLGGTRANAGYVVRVFYDNIGATTTGAIGITGTAVADLLNAKATDAQGQVYNVFPNGPNGDGSPLLTEPNRTGQLQFQALEFGNGTPSGAVNYGSMFQGYLEPPGTGRVTFFIASDDSSELWLSTDINPANKRKIAFVDGHTGVRQWDKYPSQQSAEIDLVQGQSYYFQVLHKQSIGADHVSVGWELPDGTQQRPIPSLYLQPYPTTAYALPSFHQQPVNLTVPEHSPATFSITVNGTPASYQWYRGITPIPNTPIPGAVNSWYTLPFPTLADNGAWFKVVVGTVQGLLISVPVQLTVTVDTTPPALVSASANVFDPAMLRVNFSEPVTADTASDVANYALNNGAAVYGAVVESPTSVILYTSVLMSDVQYTLTGNGMMDLATVPNTMANSQVNFRVGQFVEYKVWSGLAGTTINDLLGSVNFQRGAFDQVSFLDRLESPWQSGANFISQIQALLIPPADGNYRFWLYANDAGLLYLSTDENPANKVAIAAFEGSTSQRQYNKLGVFTAANAAGDDGSGAVATATAFSYTNIFDVQVTTTNLTILTNIIETTTPKTTNYTLVTNIVESTEKRTNIWHSNSTTNVTTGGSATVAASGAVDPNGNNNAIVITARATGDYYNGIIVVFVDDVAVGAERAEYDTATKTFTIHKNAASTANQVVAGINARGQVSDAIALVGGRKYYLEADLKAGMSMHGIGVAWQKPGDAPVQDGAAPISSDVLAAYRTLGPIVVTNQPQNVVVVAGQPATFSIGNAPIGYGYFSGFSTDVGDSGVDGTPPYSYQWYKNGVLIPGATATSYTAPSTTLADNGSAFTVLVKNNFSLVASANATLTVTSAAPTVQASGIFNNSVTALFSVPVNAAQATTLANYTLKSTDGSVIPVTGATLADDARTVSLVTGPLAANGRYTLAVSNVTDQANPAHVMVGTVLNIAAFNFLDIVTINNDQPSSVTPGGITIALQGGGADISGASDQFVYAYQQVTGNFDYMVKVDALDRPDNLTKAGLMARLSLDADSRNVFSLATPATGANAYQFQSRDIKGGATSTSGGNPAANYPTTWIRLQRVGSLFNGFWSVDGQNWTLYASKDTATSAEGAFPDTLYIGVALASRLVPIPPYGGGSAHATISNFGQIPIPATTITAQPPSPTVMESRTTTLSVAVTGWGPLTYQWQYLAAGTTNWVDIPGATAPNYTTAKLSGANAGDKYRIRISNPYTTIVSGEATLSITPDVEPPVLLSGAAINGARYLVLRFDESLDPDSAGNFRNYRIQSPYLGSISGASLREDDTMVIIDVTRAITSTLGVIAQNIKDLAGNSASNSLTTALVSLIDADIGSPAMAGITYPLSADEFDTEAGGSGFQGTADAFHFLYQEITGDFDVRVRVEGLQAVAGGAAQAGLMIREFLAAGSRDLNLVVDATQGANVWEFNYRAATNGASAPVPGFIQAGPVPYPNAWVRLTRQGNVFSAFRSADGFAWLLSGQLVPATPYPAKVFLGMASTSGNNAEDMLTLAKFREFQIGAVGVAPRVTSLTGGPNLDQVIINFDQPMDPLSASKTANYAINGGLTVNSATVDPAANRVVLGTSAQTPEVVYTVTINSIASMSGNLIRPNTRVSFSAWAVSPGFLVRSIWNGIGSPLSNLKGNVKYPRFPDSFGYVNSFEAPSDLPASYSQRLSGFVAPKVSGNYTFYIAAKDQAELYLSTDATPANKALIAKVDNGTAIREWNKEAGQKSAAIALQAGQLYYVEALQAAGSAANNLAVTWTLPGDNATPANGSMPIGRDSLASYYNPDTTVLFITAQPQDVTVVKTQPASFSVAAFSISPNIYYQWQKLPQGTTTWLDIPGASSPTYAIASTILADNGAKLQAIVAVPGILLTSAPPATLTVLDDTVAPRIVSATAVRNSATITLRFDETLDSLSANNPENVVVFGGFNVIGAVLGTDGRTVVLTVDKPMTTSVVIWAWNIRDLASNPSGMLIPTTLVAGSSVPTANEGTVTKPMLTIKQASDQVVISWPNLPGATFTLESGSPSEGWTPVTQPVVTQGDKCTVTVPISAPNKLYRLAK